MFPDSEWDEDCEMTDVCSKIHDGSLFGACEAGSTLDSRCSPAEKTIIMALSKILDKT